MRIEEAMVHLERAINTGGSRAQGAQLVIQVQSPGSAGATPCVPVEAVVSGIDWDAGKILLVPEQPLSVAASGVEPPYPTEVEPLIRLADYQRLQADHERLQAEGDKLRACLAETAGVAVTMLYESHKADTIKEFTVEQLSQMVETTKHLADANVQVEKVYRKAWDMAHGCAGSYLEGAQP